MNIFFSNFVDKNNNEIKMLMQQTNGLSWQFLTILWFGNSVANSNELFMISFVLFHAICFRPTHG